LAHCLENLPEAGNISIEAAIWLLASVLPMARVSLTRHSGQTSEGATQDDALYH